MCNLKLRILALSVLTLAVVAFSHPVQANPKIIKAYKEAYPDAKPKCIFCHVDAMPKKADGQHENNDYGKTIKDAYEALGKDAEPTGEMFKNVGSKEDFENKNKK